MAPPLAALGRNLGRLLHRLVHTIIVLPLAAAGPLQASLLACNLVLLSIGARILPVAMLPALAGRTVADGHAGTRCRTPVPNSSSDATASRQRWAAASGASHPLGAQCLGL